LQGVALTAYSPLRTVQENLPEAARECKHKAGKLRGAEAFAAPEAVRIKRSFGRITVQGWSNARKGACKIPASHYNTGS